VDHDLGHKPHVMESSWAAFRPWRIWRGAPASGMTLHFARQILRDLKSLRMTPGQGPVSRSHWPLTP